jgi:methionyl-tRNA synthetase
MARRWFADTVPPAGPAAASDHPLAAAAGRAADAVLQGMEALDFRRAAEAALQLAIESNGFLNEQAPWSRMKQEGTRESVAADLYAVLEAARIVALLLCPLLPDLSGRMLTQLGQPIPASEAGARNATWRSALAWGGLVPGAALPEPSPVMARLELDEPL